MASARAVGAAGRVLLDDGEQVGADERADLAARGGDSVVLAADGGGAGLGGDEADVVAGAGFAEREEDAVVVSGWEISEIHGIALGWEGQMTGFFGGKEGGEGGAGRESVTRISRRIHRRSPACLGYRTGPPSGTRRSLVGKRTCTVRVEGRSNR